LFSRIDEGHAISSFPTRASASYRESILTFNPATVGHARRPIGRGLLARIGAATALLGRLHGLKARARSFGCEGSTRWGGWWSAASDPEAARQHCFSEGRVGFA
jgi:hypothetical protein